MRRQLIGIIAALVILVLTIFSEGCASTPAHETPMAKQEPAAQPAKKTAAQTFMDFFEPRD